MVELIQLRVPDPMHPPLRGEVETKVKIRAANSGVNHPNFGRNRSEETKLKMSLAKSKKVFVYSFDSLSNETTLHKCFNSYTEATKYFDCSKRTLSSYVDKNKLYKNKWIISSFLISKE